jgi:thiosulfate reductase cytochrome b subunit
MKTLSRLPGWVKALAALILWMGLLPAGSALAQTPIITETAPPTRIPTAPMHPTFALLDADGVHVLASGQPVSTLTTCGTCHDTQFIADHSFHVSVGLESFGAPGTLPNARPWEMSRGLFGGWDPLVYRYLTPTGDTLFDLTTPDWIKLLGARHVGGGPAQFSIDGTPLSDLPLRPNDPQTHSFDPAQDRLSAWDWGESGVVEPNCFLCHLTQPNLDARQAELAAGNFGWANTATLLGSGIVTKTARGWQWEPDAFLPNGDLRPAYVTVQDPTPAQCGACHGTVHTDATPLLPSALTDGNGTALRTGQLFSGQRLRDSGLNLADKASLTQPWDVHAERNLQCSNCHFSLNNPIYYAEPATSRPAHLNFDPRRLDFGDYLLRPDHNFAKGQAVQNTLAPEYKDSMRRCESCHNAAAGHDWLPYTDVHMATLSCESCHIPTLHAPALAQNDWTVITPASEANRVYRGIDGALDDVRSLIHGYEPVLLAREDIDGQTQLMPFNLITSFYWVQGTPPRPVRLTDLQAVYLDGDQYQPDILAALDLDGDGALDAQELRLDSDAKVEMVRGKLVARGLIEPRIEASIQPYNINHNVVSRGEATRDCKVCHSEDSRISRAFALTTYTPAGVEPQFVDDANVVADGDLRVGDDGKISYHPATTAKGLYLPGHNRVDWVGWVGLSALGLTLLLVVGHGGLRLYAASRAAETAQHQPALHKVYMYTFYERLWHWLQAITILLLVATGIIIHRPDTLGSLDLGLVVPLHNVLALILVANALFSAFYHFASGEIRQYLPEPHGYFSQALTQLDYYARGIFRGDPHPFQKSPAHKLNPLQQATYLVILNILLPLQILTGLLMWGTESWPGPAARLGGLAWLAPFHTLVAWLFVSFIVLHIYLTTTGHTPLGNLRAMTVGWDEVESGDHAGDIAPRPDATQADAPLRA